MRYDYIAALKAMVLGQHDFSYFYLIYFIKIFLEAKIFAQ